jgi:hypothetical protein
MPKKRKRLKLSPEDRVVGMQPRQKRDLFAGCNEPGKEWFHPDAHVFEKAFCRICKNADCIRAKGAISPWHTRMAEQVDYLLNDPEFSDMTSESHRRLAEQAFDDIGRKMMRLEIARQNQDWEIPPDEDGPTDGFDKVASPDTTDQFDEAVKKLAKARGKEEPTLPRPQGEEAPAHFQKQDDPPPEQPAQQAPVEEESPWEYDTQFPSSDGSRTYHVTLDKGDRWACECEGFRYSRKCKHIDTVRAWYEDQLRQAEESDDDDDDGGGSSGGPVGSAPATAPAPRPRPPGAPQGTAAQPPRDPRLPPPKPAVNTPMPQGGVMIGGAAPEPQPQAPAKDPWAIPKDKVVQPGARVTLKGGKKNE